MIIFKADINLTGDHAGSQKLRNLNSLSRQDGTDLFSPAPPH